ncbi:MAG: hypothetical protein WC683_09520 [bacterium]|jgi:hypothetical protein
MPPPRTQTLDPESCPEHARHCERLDRCDKRLELVEAGEKDHEHRVTVLETESKSRTKSLNAILPTVVAVLSAIGTVYSLLKGHRP